MVRLFQRQIEVSFSGSTITNATGNSSDIVSGPEGTVLANTLSFATLRTSVHVVAVGGPQFTKADIRVWGMTLDHMNLLSTLGLTGKQLPNTTVSVTAIDEQGRNLVFSGYVEQAVSDFQGGPNLPFHIVAHAGLIAGFMNPPGISKQGAAPVEELMNQAASAVGLGAVGTDASSIMSINPWYARGGAKQIEDIANDHNLAYVYDERANQIVYWPKGSSNGDSATTSPSTGMVGYPSYSSLGVKVKMLFNPSVRFGGILNVRESAITKANGAWVVYLLVQDLESFKPNGQWFTTAECTRLGTAPPIDF